LIVKLLYIIMLLMRMLDVVWKCCTQGSKNVDNGRTRRGRSTSWKRSWQRLAAKYVYVDGNVWLCDKFPIQAV